MAVLPDAPTSSATFVFQGTIDPDKLRLKMPEQPGHSSSTNYGKTFILVLALVLWLAGGVNRWCCLFGADTCNHNSHMRYVLHFDAIAGT